MQQLTKDLTKLTPQQREIVRFRVAERARLAAYHVADTFRVAGLPELQAQKIESSVQTMLEALIGEVVPVQLETGVQHSAKGSA